MKQIGRTFVLCFSIFIFAIVHRTRHNSNHRCCYFFPPVHLRNSILLIENVSVRLWCFLRPRLMNLNIHMHSTNSNPIESSSPSFIFTNAYVRVHFTIFLLKRWASSTSSTISLHRSFICLFSRMIHCMTTKNSINRRLTALQLSFSSQCMRHLDR